MITSNYHTHTHRCKHARGTVSEYARSALETGITILGMSDHTPLPDRNWPHVRMEMEELDGYEAEISTARKVYPSVTILKGMECDWKRDYYSFYAEELSDRRNFDYLIGAVHWFPYRGKWISAYEVTSHRQLPAYGAFFIEAMESGLFLFMAHPDAFGAGYGDWDSEALACSRDIAAAAEELQVPLEINGYGFRKMKKNTPSGERFLYPLPEFWEAVAQYNVSGVCNSDAHKPEHVAASISDGVRLARKHGIPLVDPLETAQTREKPFSPVCT